VSDLNDELGENDIAKGTSIVEVILRDYLPYWPVLLTAAIIGMFIGQTYLQTLVPKYQINASILFKDESQSSENLIKTAVTGKSPTMVEDELEVMKGMNVMKRAALMAKAQVILQWEGRMRTSYEHLPETPFAVSIFNPDSISSRQFTFKVSDKTNEFEIGKLKFKFGEIVELDGIRCKFSLREGYTLKDLETYQSNSKHKLSINFFSLETAASKLSGSFSAEKDKSNSLIYLSVTNVSNLQGIDWLTAIIQSYQEETQLEKRKKARYTMDFIDDRLSYVGEDLDSIEKRLESFKKENNIDKVSDEAERYLTRLKSGDELASKTELQLTVLEDLERYVKGRISKPGMAPSSIGLTDANLNGYFDKLFDAENRYSLTLAQNGPNSDAVQIISKEIQTYKVTLLEIIANTRNNLLTIQRKSNSDYNKYYGEYESVMRTIPSKERQLLNITRQQNIKNALYTFLLEKREESAIQNAGILSDIRIVNEPAGAGKISPVSSQVVGGFVLGAIFIIVMVLFVKSTVNNKILSRTEVESRTRMPILGEIIQTESESPLIMKEGNRSLISEQIRGMRTNLSFFGDTKGKSKLLVSSSFPGEGKSFIASNIAIGFSMTGKRTVIIESDLRKPNIAKHFNITRRTGLSVYLSGSAEIKDIIFAVPDYPNLFVIPAGPIPPSPVELIMNGKYELLIDELSLNYDHIVIDCPPIGLVTDAQEIAKWVDFSVFIVRHRFTPRDAVSNILDRIYREKNFPKSAIVLNGMKGGISGYGYGYNYGYGRYGYGGSYGYGAGYGKSYGYGYYGGDKTKKYQMTTVIKQAIFAPFRAFFGI
jgi:capsular exopolysaccharide synthesis family protein